MTKKRRSNFRKIATLETKLLIKSLRLSNYMKNRIFQIEIFDIRYKEGEKHLKRMEALEARREKVRSHYLKLLKH